MEFLKIVAFSVLAAVGYGILHDMVTAHVCVEYFTIGHPPVFPTTTPFLLALGWGVIATWWVGLPLGLGAAVAARVGSGTRQSWREIRPLLLMLLAGMAVCAAVTGIVSAIAAAQGYPIAAGWEKDIPAEKWIAFNFDLGAHTASYASGIFGGMGLVAFIVWRRFRKPAG